MAGGTIERNEGAVLLAAGRDARQRLWGPSNSRRRPFWRLRRGCGPSVPSEANRAAEGGPGTERGIVLLKSPQHDEPDEEGDNEHHSHRPPSDARPRIVELG